LRHDASGEFSEEDLIAQDNVLVSYSAACYIKRMAKSRNAFREQGRGGGRKGMATRDEDA
jgi:DNA gyrase subunit A